jgi:ABC-type proline/glycine betaine transport system permease subunit
MTTTSRAPAPARASRVRRAACVAWLGWLAAGLAGGACVGPPPPPGPEQANRLAGRTATGSPGVERAAQICDGVLAPVGDFWNTGLTAILPSPQAFVTIDLGEPQAIDAAFLQGDNNDRYVLSGSLDGSSFAPIWDALPMRGSGLRVRTVEGLGTRARYLRLSADGGDGMYSVSELQVFSVTPAVWPEPPGGNAAGDSSPLTQWILLFGVACGLFLIVGCHGGSQRAAIAALAPAAAGLLLLSELRGARPFSDQDVSMLRVMAAAVALLAVVRPSMSLGPVGRRWGCKRGRTTAMLAAMALLAVACFYNLGRPQFWDAKLRRPSAIHNYDMRVYFPVAKYFHELRYDGLYLASVAAYIENTPGESVQTLAAVELRDLRTHEMRRVRDVAGQIQAVNQRFSPERWAEFRRDMRYFHETMGRDYFTTLSDHGGNATPVWLTVAHFMFAKATAGNGTLLASALLDPLLLLLFAVVIGRTFGARTAFVCLIVFGANDFYMFGTNWAGSTLRNDWMVALGLGVAAIKTRRFYLGGVLLAYAGLVRAFPAVAVLGLGVPPIWWSIDRWRADGRRPSLRALAQAHEGALRALAGAAAGVIVLVALSAAVLSPGAWTAWAKKASVLASGYHVNHISLRSLASADFETWDQVPDWWHNPARVIFYVGAIVVFVVLTLRAGRGRPAHHAALVGLFSIPVVFYPANYYFHYVFLLPLLALTEGDRRRDVWIWGTLLAMCVAEYRATVASSLAGHFVTESVVLLAGFLAILIVLAREPAAQRDVAAAGLGPG